MSKANAVNRNRRTVEADSRWECKRQHVPSAERRDYDSESIEP